MQISGATSVAYPTSGGAALSAETVEMIDEIVTTNMETATVLQDVGVSMLKHAMVDSTNAALNLLKTGGIDMYI